MNTNFGKRLGEIASLVCTVRNLAEELESDASTVEGQDQFHYQMTAWRDAIETVEGEIDDWLGLN